MGTIIGGNTNLKNADIGVQIRCSQREKNLVHREVKSVQNVMRKVMCAK